MIQINIAPIVEGKGDNAAMRNLLWRVWTEIVGGDHAEVLQPVRRSRGKLLKFQTGDLEKAINFAALKLQQVGGGLVLILIDAEDDCATYGPLGPLLLTKAKEYRSDIDLACVIANVMYETWFVAAASSLSDYLNIPPDVHIPIDPESARAGKGWIKKYIRAAKYSEMADQARLTTKMDLKLCRDRSPSFAKLCRELEIRFRDLQAHQS